MKVYDSIDIILLELNDKELKVIGLNHDKDVNINLMTNVCN